MTTKVCSRCKVEKDLSEFGKEKRTKDGYKYHCKKCNSIICKERYKKTHPNAPGKGMKKGYWEKLTEEEKQERIKKMQEARKNYWDEKAPLPETYQRRFDPWQKEKFKFTLPTPCRALRVHAKQLKDDPDRLTTDFIKEIAGIKKRECPGVSE